MNPSSSAALLAALLCTACAHRGNLLEAEVRAVGGKGRSFEYDPAKAQFVAFNSAGRLLELWMKARTLDVVGRGAVPRLPRSARVCDRHRGGRGGAGRQV